jgi:hypothetical protein
VSSESLSAEEIAERQLLSAFARWHEKDYVAAITLAGAAEEILGKRLRRLGREPSFDNFRNAVMAIANNLGEVDPKLESTVSSLINQTKNELKHYAGDECLEFDLKADAQELLERAIANYTMLTGAALPEMIEFWGSVDGAQPGNPG